VILSLLIVPALHVTLIGALSGLVGAFAYLDRRIFFAESVTHGTFPGAVLGVVVAASLGLGHSGMSAALYVGAFLGTIPLVALMRYLASIPGISSQGAAGIVLTAGFAAGYFLATWFKPLPLAVSSFLTGSVMTVSPADVWWAGAVLLLAAVLVAVGHRQLLAHCFDPVEPGAARGAARNERIILGLILAAVTVAIPAVGTILSIALIAAPAAALAPSARSARSFLIGCPLLGAALGLAGLGIAVPARLSAGGTIALLCAACVLASRVPAWMRARGTARPRAAVASH
jgi:putative ABC transport system membrane protein